jgi:hypothetical protein
LIYLQLDTINDHKKGNTMNGKSFWKREDFTLINNGGGTTAYNAQHAATGANLYITDGEAEAPTSTDQPHTLTATNDEGEIVYQGQFKNAEETRNAIQRLARKVTTT